MCSILKDNTKSTVGLSENDFGGMKEYALKRAREIMDNANYLQAFKITITFPDPEQIPTIEYNVLEGIVPLNYHEKYGAGAKR